MKKKNCPEAIIIIIIICCCYWNDKTISTLPDKKNKIKQQESQEKIVIEEWKKRNEQTKKETQNDRTVSFRQTTILSFNRDVDASVSSFVCLPFFFCCSWLIFFSLSFSFYRKNNWKKRPSNENGLTIFSCFFWRNYHLTLVIWRMRMIPFGSTKKQRRNFLFFLKFRENNDD